jgi:lipopolysaccharide transport system ATP-binding protein
MSDLALRVEGLRKRYRIGARREPYQTLRDTVARLATAPFRSRERAEHIWALNDISFDVRWGEVVGIIGRNGAGKTTLLKVLSRITEPTEGAADVWGRLGSLLEVGTGFHPELTGRENVFLNGAILGMTRAEIARRFDEIVAFAEVETFLDTPVKHYSSGMYVRLAFAVAAHLEPEILLVDEVLAVGDAAFQRRCLGKMREVSQAGRTVLLVSHHMGTVQRLCERVILLDEGRVVKDGPAEPVVSTYLQTSFGSGARRAWPVREEAPGNETVRLYEVRVVDREGKTREAFDVREAVGIEMTYDVLVQTCPLVPLIALFNERGVCSFNAVDTDRAWQEPRKSGRWTTTAWIPGNLLSEGLMSVTVLMRTLTTPYIRHFAVSDAVSFRVSDPVEGDTAIGDYVQLTSWRGGVRPILSWTTSFEDAR